MTKNTQPYDKYSLEWAPCHSCFFLEPQYDTEAVVVDHKLPPKTYRHTESNKYKYSIDKKKKKYLWTDSRWHKPE